MNTEVLIQIFLPYHESPNFPRMLAILTVPTTSIYHAPFHPLIKNAQPLPRSYITTAISPAKERTLRLLQDVVNLVPKAIEEKTVHRALLAFWSATMVELLEKSRSGKGVTEGLVKVLVEAFVNILSTPEAGPEVSVSVRSSRRLCRLHRETLVLTCPSGRGIPSPRPPHPLHPPRRRALPRHPHRPPYPLIGSQPAATSPHAARDSQRPFWLGSGAWRTRIGTLGGYQASRRNCRCCDGEVRV